MTLAFAALACLAAAGEADEDAGAAAAPDPPALYQAVMRVHLDLEMLRWVFGDPRVAAVPWEVSAVAPRHLLRQAHAMYRKAHQLAEEIAGTKILPLPQGTWRRARPRPVPRDRALRLADVLQVVVDAQHHIRAAIALQNIKMAGAPPPERDAAKTAADVLVQIVQANRQLNILLHREVSTRELHNVVRAAVGRAGDLLGGHYPPLPPRLAGQRPDDVYRSLVRCLGLLQPAASQRQIRPLGLDLDRELVRQDVSHADVYHLATTLLSDLEYMTVRLESEATTPPRGEYPEPRFVFPSHVQQIASVLEQQLRVLAARESD